MKALTILLFSLFSLPLMLNAQTVDEMLLNPGNSEKERGRIKYCIFPYIAGESRYILKGVFYSSPAKGRNGRAVFAPGHILCI